MHAPQGGHYASYGTYAAHVGRKLTHDARIQWILYTPTFIIDLPPFHSHLGYNTYIPP